MTACAVLFAGLAICADIDVSQPTYMTANGAYDRNPSVLFDGSEYWLFFTKGDDVSTGGVRESGYNPDADNYVIYYKKAGTIAALAAASESKLELSETGRPADFSQRVASAVLFDGKIYCFASSGQDGINRGLYYYEYDSGTWSGPTELIADAAARGGHVNVTTNGDYIFIVWESSDGSSDCYVWDGAALSNKIDISDGNQPKITFNDLGSKVGGNLYVVNIEDGTGDIEIFFAEAGSNPYFVSHSTAIPGGGFYDPCIYTDGTNLYVITAPYVPDDRQYLVQAWFDANAASWSTPRFVSYGGHKSAEWWEYWPCVYYDGTDAHLFFATETDDGPFFSDGEIACITLDWDLSHDHFFHIQNAVDNSSPGDTIAVSPGVYTEQIYITTEGLTITGAGVDDVTVKSPAALTDYFVTGTNNNYPVIFIDGVTAAIANLTVDGDNQGDSNYRFIGIGFWNAGGTVSNVTVLNIMNSTFSGAQHGVGIYSYNDTGGPYAIALSNILVDDFQKTAVALSGSGLSVDLDDVTTIGEGETDVTAQNGIQIGPGVTGTIDDCTISLIAYTGDTWTATGLLNWGNVTATHVALDQCQTSVYWQEGSGIFDQGIISGPIGDGFYAYNSTAKSAGPRLQAQPFGDMVPSGDKAAMNVILSNSIITGVGNEFSWGVGAFSTSADDVTLTVTGCRIANWDYGFYAYDYGGGVSATVYSNSITSCTYALGSNTATVQNASGNRFGTADPAEVAALIDGDIDYTPWLSSGTDTSSDPGFQGDYSSIWVDDDSPQSGSLGRIHEAIGIASSSTIYLAAGAYEEQVVVDRNIQLIGEGKDITTIQSPVTLTEYFSTSQDNYPVVYIHDADDVQIQSLTVDGLGRGNGNYRFYGVAFWNAGGEINTCHITNIIETPFSGSQHGLAIYAYNNTGGPYNISVIDTDVDEFQKNGITLMGEGLTVDIDGCVVTGKGVTPTIAQNGIQVGYGAGGAITDCNISGYTWDGPTWYSGGLLLIEGLPVDISGCVFNECQVSIWYIETSGTTDNCTIVNPTADGLYVDSYAAKGDYGLRIHLPQPVAEDYSGFADKADPAVTVTNCVLTGSGAAGYSGIYPWAENPVSVDVTGCTITGWDYGCQFADNGAEISASVNYTRLHDNSSYGIYADAIHSINGEHNYWGDTSGPYYDPTITATMGTTVSDNVDFEPWCNYDFTVCDFGQVPQVVLNSPFDGGIMSDPFAELSASVSDESPLEVRIYGDHDPSPSNLLYVQEDVIGLDVDILYSWTAQVLAPEGATTMGLWHFDENNGAEVTDASVHGNTGTCVNYDNHPWTLDGRFGYAIDFDGEDDYIEIPDVDNSLDVDPSAGALTIEAWIYPHASGEGIYRAFISKRDSAFATMVNYAVYLDEADGALTLYNGNFPAGYYISNIIPTVDEWSYVVISMDAAEGVLRFYLNGEIQDSVTGASFGPIHDGSLTIGTSKTPAANRDYDGLIDEVRLTGRVLSDAEIMSSYQLNAGTFYWKVTADDGNDLIESDTWHFTAFDTISPTVEVLSPASGRTWDHMPTLELSFADDAGLQQAFYQIGGCSGAWTEFWSYDCGAIDTTITWTIPEMADGEYDIYFRVVDDADNNNDDMCDYFWTFTKLTYAPEITSTPVTDGATGQPYIYDVESSAAPVATYALLSAIPDMTIDDTSGIINWTPLEAGSYPVSVEAFNIIGADTQEYVLTVVDTLAPVLSLIFPDNGVNILGTTTDLEVSVVDHSNVTVWIFGDRTPSAADMLHAEENMSETDLVYSWTASVFEPDPPYTRGLWHMDENQGTAVGDESFSDNTGIIVGNPDWTADGRFGYALDCDGSGDYITVPDTDNSLDIDSAAGELTLEAWILPHAAGSGSFQGIVSKRGFSGVDLVNYAMYLDSSGVLTLFTGDYPNRYYPSSVLPPADVWSYVAITVDSNRIARYYLNGDMGDSILGVALGPANDEDLTIGTSINSGQYRCFNGIIDEVRLTSRALASSDIAAVMQLSGTTYWRVVAEDASGNTTMSSTRFFNVQSYVCGDSNGDDDLNVGDVVFLIAHIFKGGPEPNPACSGDANGDGDLNIGDAVYLIAYVFRGGPAPDDGCCP